MPRECAKWVFWGEVLILQPLLFSIVIQWRGLNGSKGELNAFLSWLIVFNSGVLWALAFLNSSSNAGRSEGIQWLERVLREYYTWATSLSSGLSLITRGSSPPCPDDFTVLDIQFCSSAQTGHVNYDNFILLLIIQLIHREYVPCDWIYTCFGSVIGIVCVAFALALGIKIIQPSNFGRN